MRPSQKYGRVKHMTRDDRIKVTFGEALKILSPYFYVKTAEQIRSLLPIIAYLFLFQIIVLKMAVYDGLIISAGLVAVLFGLAFFLEGLKLGLMPFAEIIGTMLPRRSPLYVIIGFAFLVGMGATFAEPAIGTLKLAGANIDPAEAPLLYAILTKYSGYLVGSVGVGVGIATVLGILRFLCNWSLKIFIYPLVFVLTAMTIWAQSIPEMASIIGLAWDCGAVTTGPVTVPLVLALGIGVSRITGKSDTGMSGFGIVTLASLFPIIAVLGLGFYLHYSGADLAATAGAAATAVGGDWKDVLIDGSMLALRAIVPLCLFLFLVQRFILRESIVGADEISLGIVFTVFGMALFNVGLALGLSPLGGQVGSTVPAAFSEIAVGRAPDIFELGPLYGSTAGKVVAIAFAFVLGYGATMAEPALSALGTKVEEITIGAFRKSVLIQAVSIGVGVGIATGITKIIFNIPLPYLLIPPYMLVLFLTVISTEEFVNIGWDSAGVTTGPITVPLVIATGLGVGGNIPGVVEGFGILSLASIFPIISVLTVGLLVRKQTAVPPEEVALTEGAKAVK